MLSKFQEPLWEPLIDCLVPCLPAWYLACLPGALLACLVPHSGKASGLCKPQEPADPVRTICIKPCSLNQGTGIAPSPCATADSSQSPPPPLLQVQFTNPPLCGQVCPSSPPGLVRRNITAADGSTIYYCAVAPAPGLDTVSAAPTCYVRQPPPPPRVDFAKFCRWASCTQGIACRPCYSCCCCCCCQWQLALPPFTRSLRAALQVPRPRISHIHRIFTSCPATNTSPPPHPTPRRAMISPRSRVLKICDEDGGVYTQATDSCSFGNPVCPATQGMDYTMQSDSLNRPWCIACNAGWSWDAASGMCLVNDCTQTSQAGAGSSMQTFQYTVGTAQRTLYYCGASAAATSSTQVSGFAQCTVAITPAGNVVSPKKKAQPKQAKKANKATKTKPPAPEHDKRRSLLQLASSLWESSSSQ